RVTAMATLTSSSQAFPKASVARRADADASPGLSIGASVAIAFDRCCSNKLAVGVYGAFVAWFAIVATTWRAAYETRAGLQASRASPISTQSVRNSRLLSAC